MMILWLTLPQCQGSFRLYILLIKPYFAQYEDDIDRHLEIIGNKVKQKASRHIQAILWQLFLAPNDGIISLAMVSSASRYFFNNNNNNNNDNNNNNNKICNDKSSSQSLCHLLNDFTSMLSGGIYVTAGWGWGHDDVSLTLCRCQLMHGRVLCFYFDDDNNDSTISSRTDATYKVPILNILSVASDVDDASLLNLTLVLGGGVYLKVDDAEVSESFLRGLHMLILDMRTRARRTLMVASKRLQKVNSYQMTRALHKLRCYNR